MSINRIDLQGAVLRTSDVAQHGAQDASKISVDQNNFASQFTREIEEKLTSVNETNKTDKKEEKFDAKEKGSNEYYRDEGEKKEKKQTDWLTAQIMAIMEKSMKAALKAAMDDLLKGFK